ncbi:hypothetical protein [Streptomyces erythrochromogenes]|uniref:hypothetical protein n=1 Tax=Streptomyces erythrochromogenes TaxID=285574 RepID=UPI00368F433E
MQRRVDRVPARPGHLFASLQLPAFVNGRNSDVLALRPVRDWRTNASSAPVNVKYRIGSARSVSGKPRSRAGSSAGNTS